MSFVSSIASAQPPLMGTNLHAPTDWSNALVSTDLMWHSRDWFSGTASIYDDGRTVPLDANGWPTSLLPGQYAKTVLSTNSNHQPSGTYTVRWQGQGSVFVDLGSNTVGGSSSPFTFVMPSTISAVFLEIRSTTVGNHVRNIDVLVPGATEETWYPPFIESLQGYDTLRFMDWARVNNNSEYSGPAPGTYYTLNTHNKGGASPVRMAQLCNELGANMWFCVHDLATPTQMRAAAEMIRDNLNPALKVYLEWSNEIWNNPFSQAKRAIDRGPKMFPNEPDTNKARYMYQGVKSEEMFAIFENVLGDDRIINVIGAQAGNVWTAMQIQPMTPNAEAVATAPYYKGQHPIETVVRERIEIYQAWAKASQINLRHIAYEGGQHFVNSTDGQLTVNQSIAYNRSQQVYTDYIKYFQQWEDLGGELFVHFQHIGHVPNSNGSWGSYERFDQPNHPKHRAIRETMVRWGQTSSESLPPPGPFQPFSVSVGEGMSIAAIALLLAASGAVMLYRQKSAA